MIHWLEILPVEEVWKSSTLSLGTDIVGNALPIVTLPTWISVLVCCLVVMALIFFDRIILSFGTAITILFRENMIKEYLDNSYRTISLNTSMILIFPLLSFIIYNNGLSSLPYYYIITVMATLLVIKLLAIKIIRWLSGCDKKIEGLMNYFFAGILLITLLSLPFIVICKLLEINRLVINFYLITVTCIIYLISLFRSRQLILKSNFSHIFCFLYLCALEIIPFALAIRIIIQ